MNGLIRGKRLVWVLDGKCWRAESQFGVYRAYDCGGWDLSSFDDRQTINEGEATSADLAKSACQSDHDLRAMASIQVGPFEWVGDTCNVGQFQLSVTHRLSESSGISYWRWAVWCCSALVRADEEYERDKAITAAEQFVTRLVMGDRE